MKQTITQKQQEILLLIYKYRFLNRIQIQKFQNHKYHKRINDWLKDLTEKEYLNRIYSNKFGENTLPAIYYIGLNGIKYLSNREYYSPEILRKFNREKNFTESFIEQCILIADIALDLYIFSNENKDNTINVSYSCNTTTDLTNPENHFNYLVHVKPDLLIKKQTKKKTRKKIETSFFIFTIISPTLPRNSIRKRIKDFIVLYNEGQWEDNEEHPFPTIMVVCPILSTMIYTKRLTTRLLEEENPEDLTIQFTTVQRLREHGVTDEIWEEV